jgi:hypothetical protein
MKRRLLWPGLPILVLVAGAVILFLATRQRMTDEEQIRATFLQLEQDIRTRNAAGILSIVSKGYRDQHGFDYPAIRSLVFMWTRSQEKDELTLYNLKLHVEKKKAHATALAVVRRSTGSRLEFTGNVELVKEGRDWRVVSTSGWQESAPEPDYGLLGSDGEAARTVSSRTLRFLAGGAGKGFSNT